MTVLASLRKTYENMRAVALAPSRTSEIGNSYGRSVLNKMGVLAWAKICIKLHFNEPLPVRMPAPKKASEQKGDVVCQLTEIMTQMALNFVERG